jgi:alkanesulfonate monooxygenase
MVAGGFRTDLAALGDLTPHDDRYVRAVEYATIVKALVAGQAPVTFDGRYYSVTNLKLLPPLAPELAPGIVISGSSQAGLEAAKAIGATAVKYPKPPGEEDEAEDVGRGVRVGIIAREDVDEAWRVALGRFPEDRKGQITHALAMKVSDSKWHEQLADLGGRPVGEENPYWLGPFKNYKTFCPYLVGSYDAVGIELGRYMGQGFRTFILDVPASEDEFDHTAVAFERAAALHP